MFSYSGSQMMLSSAICGNTVEVLC